MESLEKKSKSISETFGLFLYGRETDFVSGLIGSILTITDAAAQDDVQRKAFKDLITETIWRQYHQNLGAVTDVAIDQLRAKLGEPETKKPPINQVCWNVFE